MEMADVEMQGIEFQIVNDGEDAIDSVERLSKALSNLQISVKGSASTLSRVANETSKLKKSLEGIDTTGIGVKLKGLSEAVNNLSIDPSAKISASLPKNITALNEAVSESKPERILELGQALQSIAAASSAKISAALPKNITSLGEAAAGLDDSASAKIKSLGDSFAPLSSLGPAHLTSYITQLGKFPKLIKDLDGVDLAKFSQQMQDLATAMKPLADEMGQISAGFSAFPSRIRRLIASTDQYSGAAQRAVGQTNSFGNALKSVVSFALYRKAYKGIASMLRDTTEYTETINLFTASMGEYAKESYDFAKKASDVMGVDISEWMQEQGVFNTIITGFGVSGDKAAYMSRNLTQLGYDLASFYNTDVASAMQKVQAGISGELEPLRRLGYDLSAARLQEEATALGITKKVSAMDQAEKSMLRYYAIMTQVTVAQGDMARTLESPANQLRVLKSQVNLAAQEIGSLFIPALNAILPYAIAAMKAIRALAASIASLFGVQLASVDYSGISGASSAAGDLNENLSAAGGSAADLKNQLAGFDELNVIQSQGGGGAGGGSSTGSGDFGDIELPGYDFLKDAVSTKVDKIYNKLKPLVDWATDHLQEIGLLAGTIGATLLAWRLSNKFFKGIDEASLTLGQIHSLIAGGASAVLTIGLSYILENKGLAGGKNENWDKLIASWITAAVGSAVTGKIVKRSLGATAGKYAAGATLAISTLTSIKAIYDDVKADGFDGKTLADGIWAAIKGAAAGGLIALAAGASIAVGASIGAGLTLAGIALALTIANIDVDPKKAKWGNLALTKEQITKYVQDELFTIDVTATIGAIDSVISDLNSEKGKLNAAIEDFNQSLVLVKLGVDEQGSYQKMLTALTGGTTDGTYTDDSILGRLEAITQQSSVAVKLGFSTLVGDSSADIGKLLDTSDAIIQSETQRIGKELADLLAKGVNEGLDANEQEMAIALSDTLSRIAQVATQENINTEFLGNLAFTLADMDQGSFDSVMEQFATLKAQLREQYQSLAITTLAGMKSRYATLLEIGTPEALEKAEELKAEIDEFTKNMTAYVDEAVERVAGQGAKMIAARVREAFSGVMTTDEFMAGHGITEELTDLFVQSAEAVSVEDVANRINESVESTLAWILSKEDYNSIKIAAEAAGKSFFEMLPQDVQSGLYSYLSDFLSSENVVNFLGSDYTDQVFESLGYNAGNSFYTGFADNTLNTQFGFDTGSNVIFGLGQNDWAGAGASDGAAYANGFRSAASSAAEFSKAWTGRYYGDTSTIRKKIKGYATGGYPKSGELFWARENGTPEMVGKMGSSTAVANNDQIVSSIASGVASASEESNDLLREQNELLRRLLQKEFTAEVSPSAEFGRVVAKSSRMYEKVYG